MACAADSNKVEVDACIRSGEKLPGYYVMNLHRQRIIFVMSIVIATPLADLVVALSDFVCTLLPVVSPRRWDIKFVHVHLSAPDPITEYEYVQTNRTNTSRKLDDFGDGDVLANEVPSWPVIAPLNTGGSGCAQGSRSSHTPGIPSPTLVEVRHSTAVRLGDGPGRQCFHTA